MKQDEVLQTLREVIEETDNLTTWTVSTPHLVELVKRTVEAEREACAKAAGRLWQQFQDTKDAHERNTMESFKPDQFGFNLFAVQQSQQMMDAIRARGNT